VAALLLLAAAAGAWALWSVPGEVDRLYLSWTRDRIAAPIAAGDLQPSGLAPVAWGGGTPLAIRLPRRHGAVRLELKLRTTRGPVRLVLEAGSREVARWRVGRRWRVYGVWLPPHVGSVSVRVAEGAGPVHISRVKVTNVVGYAEGVVEAWIVPRGAPRRPAPAAIRAGLVGGWLLCLGVGAGLVRVRRACVDAAARAAAASSPLVAAAVVLSLWRLALVAAPRTVVILAVAGAAAGAVPALPRWVARRRAVIRVRPRVLAEAAMLAALLAMWVWALTLIVVGEFGGDVRGVARFGWKFPNPPVLEEVPEPSRAGYDGQFYATLATDPWLRDPATVRAMDNPAYRGTRVLLPALAWVISRGRADLAPRAYVLLCWLVGLAAVVLVHLELRPGPWWWVATPGVALSAGLVCSLLRATPDAAAAALLLAALLVAGRGRAGAAAALGLLAALARETSVLALPAVALPAWRSGRRLRAAATVGVPAAAVLAWRAHLVHLTGRGTGSALANFALPLAWLGDKVVRLVGAGERFRQVEGVGMAWVALALVATVALAARPRRLGSSGLAFVGFGALAWVLGIRVYTEVNAYARVLVALPALAALALPEAPRRWVRAALVALLFLSAVQGSMVLHDEVAHARWRLERGAPGRVALAPPSLSLSGAWRRDGDRVALPPGGDGTVTARLGTRSLRIGVVRGAVRVERRERTVARLAAGDLAVLPLPAGREGALRFRTGGRGALLELAESAPARRTGSGRSRLLVPGVASVLGTAGRWRTELALRAAGPSRTLARLVLWPRTGDSPAPLRAVLPLPGRGARTVGDAVAAVFGVEVAGVLEVEGTGGPVEVEARLVLERGAEAWAWPLPVLPGPQTLPLRWRHDGLRAGRVDVLVANPSVHALALRLESRGRRFGSVTLAPNECGSSTAFRRFARGGWISR